MIKAIRQRCVRNYSLMGYRNASMFLVHHLKTTIQSSPKFSHRHRLDSSRMLDKACFI